MKGTLYKPAEAAVILRVSRGTVLRYARSGLLSGSQPGGKLWLFSQEGIDAFLAGDRPSAKPQRKPSRRPGR